MKYGYFDDTAREYVVTTPHTPLPWINYLGSEDFFSLISHTGGGYSFYRDAKLRRLTRYRYNNVPRDSGGRNYYICEGEDFWSPAFLPAGRDLDTYRCRHGMGYTIVESSRRGLDVGLTCFVPQGDACEVNRLEIKNTSNAAKSIAVVSAAEWCLWNAVDDSTNYQRNFNTGEVEVDGSVLYHKTEYRERRNHYAFYAVNHELAGFDTDRESFLGMMGGWEAPQALTKGHSGNSIAHGWAPIASHRVELRLEPGESKTLVFVLGYVELPEDEKWESHGIINKAPAREMMARYADAGKVEAALERLREYWRGLLGRFWANTGSDKFDRMLNIWHQYQCMVTFNLSRSASYYESGTGRGMGFRDSCQDILGFVHIAPQRARQRILDIAAIQMDDGSTWHQYQPLTKQGNADVGSGFNDDPLWLVACTYAYIAETGDMGILNEMVQFDNQPGSEASLMEHLHRSVDYTLANRGPHGLPLIGRADWNDCLNLNCFSTQPGESFQTCDNSDTGVAESVFIAGMFVLYGGQYAQLCAQAGQEEEAERILQAAEEMRSTILQHGWDGEWFLRAYDAFGGRVGSCENAEGQIYIEPQGMCVMAGVGVQEGLAHKALSSVAKRLDTQYGICLLSPCYTRYYPELGEISSYPPGYKENGGIFCHNNPWVSIAHTVLGNAEQAFEVYKKTCPAWLEDAIEVHRTEPYVYSQMVAGQQAPTFGEAKNSWLTGTAAWAFVNASQHLLGIQPTLEGLRIAPCLPEEFGDIKVRRLYRGIEYDISIRRTGTRSLCVDGARVDGAIVKHVADGRERAVVEATY